MPINTVIKRDRIAYCSKKLDDLFLYFLNSSTGLPWLKANISEYVFKSADFLMILLCCRSNRLGQVIKMV